MDERTLYETLLARPDDPTIAQVFADSLLERGDPMAEFFTLHGDGTLAKGPAQRAQDLLIMHWKRWFGPLATVLRRRACTFQGGFLRKAEFLLSKDVDVEAIGRAAQLASVNELVIGDAKGCSLAALFGSPWLANLKKLSCEGLAVRDATRTHFTLDELRLSGEPDDVPPSDSFRHLSLLDVAGSHRPLDGLRLHPKRLRALVELEVAVTTVRQAAGAVEVPTELVSPGWTFALSPGEPRVAVHLSAMDPRSVNVVNALGAVPLRVSGLREWEGLASHLRW
jgi:uncharacterized protein (TIGR02996 family)